jgi:hypothetical protein
MTSMYIEAQIALSGCDLFAKSLQTKNYIKISLNGIYVENEHYFLPRVTINIARVA